MLKLDGGVGNCVIYTSGHNPFICIINALAIMAKVIFVHLLYYEVVGQGHIVFNYYITRLSLRLTNLTLIVGP